MPPACCPHCRLLDRGRACAACGHPTVALDQLTCPRPELAVVKTEPAKGVDDTVALLATAFTVIVASTIALVVTGSAIAVLLLPALGALGYAKQYWGTAFLDRPRLDAVPGPARPAGAALVGVAQPYERTIATGVLAIATTIENREGVIVRAIDAAPFWLTLDDRRVLVTGACWAAGPPSRTSNRLSPVIHALELAPLAIARASQDKLRVGWLEIAAGDRVAVIGPVREEQLAGLGGYRDSLVETIRGEPGAVVWIDRLA